MLLLYLFLGALSGLIAVSINCYKDTPWEGFSWLKAMRSLAVGAFFGGVMYFLQARGIFYVENKGLLMLLIIPPERLVAEIYKGFVRKESHPEFYRIQSRLGIRKKRLLQYLAAGALFVFYASLAYLLYLAAAAIMSSSLPLLIKGMIVGPMATTVVAFGGGIKDSQFEGFSTKKFFRSPLMGLLVGPILAQFTANPIVLLLSSIGLERILVEYYKTFFTKYTRGVHKGKKPRFPEWFKKRRVFYITFIAINALLALLLFGVV